MMQSLTRVLFLWLTALMLVVGACSKTVEGESKKWTANTAKIAELSAMYPGFKDVLEARKAAAQKVFDAAEGLAEEQKIEKMAEANRMLMAGFVDDLEDLEGEIKELRQKRAEAASKADSAELGAKVAADEVQQTLERVEAALKSGATDEAGANAVLKKIVADLKTAEEVVDKVLKADQEKKDAAAAEKKAADEAKAAEEAKTAPWKCEYCGSSNPHDETNCKSCGAPRAGGDKAAK
ncbi:MAG TPA: hypothetical protein VIK91_24365 [Nannocystis sp.]